jgi:hypothetical protein
LILSTPDIGEVIYILNGDNVLRRAFRTGGKIYERTLPVGGDSVSAEFDRSAQNPKLLRLLLHGTRAGTPLEGQTLAIAAALGGDQR